MNDLTLGADHAKSFDDHCRESADARAALGKVEFGVQVLTTGYWPTYRVLDLVLPPAMASCTQLFKDFYDVKTSHRRLQWIHMLGNATLKFNLAKKSYDLQVCAL